jgi:hypothetical protein
LTTAAFLGFAASDLVLLVAMKLLLDCVETISPIEGCFRNDNILGVNI